MKTYFVALSVALVLALGCAEDVDFAPDSLPDSDDSPAEVDGTLPDGCEAKLTAESVVIICDGGTIVLKFKEDFRRCDRHKHCKHKHKHGKHCRD